MKILVLCGSIRADSVTLKALRVAMEEIASAGVECELLHGEQMIMPLCGALPDGEAHPAIERLRTLASQASGFLLGSPEYHGNMSGALKNALDWLGSEHFEGKPVALLSVAGGGHGGHSTLNSLRTTIRYVHGWVIPEQVSVGSSHQAFDADDRPLSREIEKRLHVLGRSLVRAAKALKQMRDED